MVQNRERVRLLGPDGHDKGHVGGSKDNSDERKNGREKGKALLLEFQHDALRPGPLPNKQEDVFTTSHNLENAHLVQGPGMAGCDDERVWRE